MDDGMGYQDPYYDPMMQSMPMGGMGMGIGGGFDALSGFYPQRLDPQTFKQRNDPKELLERFRLQLMNAYRVEEKEKDPETGVEKSVFKIRFKKDTKPKANPQGIEDIISYVEKFINSHSVQGNIDSLEEYNNRMRFISNDITVHFVGKRKDWGVEFSDVDVIVSNAINIVDMFFTRALFNEERKGYGESFKETTNRQIMPENKPNIFQRMFSGMGRRRGGGGGF